MQTEKPIACGNRIIKPIEKTKVCKMWGNVGVAWGPITIFGNCGPKSVKCQ